MTKPLLRYFLFIILFIQLTDSLAQGTSNKGTDFWLGYGTHISHGNAIPETMVLYLTSDVNTTAIVTVQALAFSQSVNIIANTVQQVTIPLGAHLGVEGKSDLGIHITSLKPIIVYSHIYNGSISGATLVLPVNTLGKDYYSINYKQVSNSNYSASFFFVVAVEDNTQVEITPSQLTQGGWQANTVHTVNLNKGEIYHVLGAYTNLNGTLGVDLTGSKIKSISSNGTCKKIAVFSGSSKISISCLTNNTGGSADNLFQQVYPTATWGKKFITVPLKDRNFDVIRIVKSDPTAVVTLNGATIPSASFVNGLYYDFESQTTNNISSDKPIQAVQYAVTQGRGINCTTVNGDVGDPEMIYLNPLEQTLTEITMYSAANAAITKHFINLVVKNEGVASFKVDGNLQSASFLPVPGSSTHSYAQISVTVGTHNMSCNEGFNAIAYGFGSAESYGYSAGANLTAFGVEPIEQSSQEVVQTGCVGNAYTLTIKLPYQPVDINLDNGDGNGSKPIALELISQETVDGETTYTYLLKKDLVFNQPNTYNFTAYVIKPTLDDCGTGDEFSFDLIINPKPVAGFSAPAQSCINSEVSFVHQTDTDEVSVTDYLWDFNGEGTSTLKDPKFTFTAAGVKTVKFSSKYNTGCWSDVVTKDVRVVALPIAKFAIALPSCEGNVINFIDQSTTANGTINNWLWDFGDPTSSTNTSILRNSTHTYSIAGTYNVKLISTTDIGCINTITQQVIVHPVAIPNFTTPDICLDDAVATFTNTSLIADNSNLTYKWDFGDPNSTNNTSTLKNPSHVYHAAANYNVKLTTTSSNNCVSEIIKVFTVNGSTPKADFSVKNENSLCSDQPVVFEDHASVDFGSITRIEWYFDNDNNSTNSNYQLIDDQPALRSGIPKTYQFNYPQFNAPVSKTVNVKMKVFSGGSCVSEIIKAITLKAVPQIVFNTLAPVCQEVEPYMLNAASETSSLPGTGVYSGNGISSSGLFTPASAGVGTHTIFYTFTANNGCVGLKSQEITVYPTPFANAGKDQIILIGGTVNSDAVATGESLTYKWSPSEGLDHDDIINPVFSPVLDTKYTLTVTNKNGCSAIDEVFIKVLQFPEISNTFTPNGDGVNDTWAIKYLESYSNVSLKVFNRSGLEVFKANNYSNPWDGTQNGNPLPEGMYYYIISAKGGELKYSGSVMIIR